MARDQLEPKIYDLQPTDLPGEWTVRLCVPEDHIDATVEIAEGCLLKNLPRCGVVDDALLKGWGNYVLTACADAPEGYVAFIFAKPKASLEDALVRRWTDVVDLPWPDVLRIFYAVAGRVVDGNESGLSNGFYQNDIATTKERVLERMDYVKGGMFPTRVLRETFQSPTPFEDLAADAMITSRVSLRFLDVSFSEDCLHPRVTVPELMTGGAVVPELGTPNPEGRDLGRGQIFPATAHTTWPNEIVLRDTQQFNGRLWVRERMTAYAPDMPPPQQIPMR